MSFHTIYDQGWDWSLMMANPGLILHHLEQKQITPICLAIEECYSKLAFNAYRSGEWFPEFINILVTYKTNLQIVLLSNLNSSSTMESFLCMKNFLSLTHCLLELQLADVRLTNKQKLKLNRLLKHSSIERFKFVDTNKTGIELISGLATLKLIQISRLYAERECAFIIWQMLKSNKKMNYVAENTHRDEFYLPDDITIKIILSIYHFQGFLAYASLPKSQRFIPVVSLLAGETSNVYADVFF